MRSIKKDPITEIRGGVRLSLYIQPSATRSEFVGFFDELIKLKIAAPPAENEANKELIRFLGEIFKISKQNISIIHGERGRRKVVEIVGKSRDEVERILDLC